MKRELAGKVVLITGGSRGLGYEIAERFLAERAQVVICARNAAEVEAAAAKLGRGTLGQTADISDPAAVQRLLVVITEKFGGLDILVNNAAVFAAGPIEETSPDDYRRMLEINLFSTMSLMSSCLPLLQARGGGVITIASAASIVPAPHLAPYAVSKAATEMYMQAFEVERGHVIPTLTVYPSYMPTGFTDHTIYDGHPDTEKQATRKLTHSLLLSITPDKAAAIIIRSWVRGRRVVIFPWAVRLGVAMRWVAPGITLAVGRWLLKRYYR